jgi:hypothetical protein
MSNYLPTLFIFEFLDNFLHGLPMPKSCIACTIFCLPVTYFVTSTSNLLVNCKFFILPLSSCSNLWLILLPFYL